MIKGIARGAGLARPTVRYILRGTRDDVFRVRASSLNTLRQTLDQGWEGGCRNGSALWRTIRALGFKGSLRIVSKWETRKRHDEAALAGHARRLQPERWPGS